MENTQATRPAMIEVEFEDEINAEPILLVYTQGVVDYDPEKSGHQFLIAESRTIRSFSFEIKSQEVPHYFSVLLTYPLRTIVLIQQYNCEPGDDVKITVKAGPLNGSPSLVFSGTGSAKYICRYEFEHLVKRPSRRVLKRKAAQKDSLLVENLRFLHHVRYLINRYQSDMSAYAYNLLYADIIGYLGRFLMTALYRKLVSLSDRDGTSFQRNVRNLMTAMDFDFTTSVDALVAHDSREYAWFILTNIRCRNLMETGKTDDVAVYHQLKNLPDGLLRDRLLLVFIVRFREVLKGGYQHIIEDAVKAAGDSLYRARIAQLETR